MHDFRGDLQSFNPSARLLSASRGNTQAGSDGASSGGDFLLHPVMAQTKLTPLPTRTGFRWWRWLVGGLGVLIVLIVAIALFLRLYGYDLAKQWVESPAGPRVAGKAVGKAIKVYGTFAPMKLDGWTIKTDSFTSKGWPGEAIGELDAYGVTSEFDLSAVMHQAWRFSGIQIEHATIRLDKPDNAIKLHPEKKPPPWYAIFLPNRFECGPMTTPDADLQFTFQGTESGIQHANVQADLIGKNMRYHADSGILDFPYVQPLRIQKLDMFVTSDAITIYTAQLAGISPNDSASVILSGRVGQHADKSIDATLAMNEISIEKILPENLRPLIHGNISGNLTWHRNTAGDDVTSEGDLKLTGASITDLSVFKELSALHGNPDLQSFTFDEANCHYVLDNGHLSLELRARVAGKFNVTGTIGYDVKTKVADLDLVFDELPLKVWLPSDFKPRYSGMAKASLKWHGQLDTREGSSAVIGINLDGTHISDPVVLRKFLATKGFRAPDEINLDKANFTFTYADEAFNLTQAELVSPGVLNAQLTGSLKPGNDLTATMDWQGLVLGTWLPEKYARQLSGELDGHIALAVRKWKFGDGSYGGDVRLKEGELSYTTVQSTLARFLGQRPLLVMPLTRTQLAWTWGPSGMTLKGIDIRGANAIGVRGDVAVNGDNELSGQLWIGAKPEYLEWLPDAETTVFAKKEGGLYWAKVKLSGTTKKPGQDFGSQVMTQLLKHPDAMVNLGCKVVSWYVGNWFGVQKEWERPQVASVEVHGPTDKKKDR